MSDNRFEPINQAHAIVEMVLFFEFISPEPDKNIERLLPLRSELEDDFPSYELLEVVEFNFGPSVPDSTPQQVQPKTGGFELRRFKSDGSFEWLIRFTQKSISIHCLEYTRWKNVWEKVNVYSGKVFDKLAGTNINLSSIGLRYLDQFVFCGDPKNYDARLLLNPSSSLLCSRAFISGARWHCYSGWFEEAKGLGEILGQVNLDSVVSNVDENRRATVLIDQVFTRRAQSETELMQYMTPGKIGSECRSNLAQWMHDANKKLLSDLLNDTVRSRISLYLDEMP
ncbi:TIGR04255 family protein [Pantanalinema sp. GBBB05]|uniref:TIGR04255 family protein n=1 Tax=Pantanalinema sp. GBBB05 TaxID=2604139 RepID=UPI003D817E32